MKLLIIKYQKVKLLIRVIDKYGNWYGEFDTVQDIVDEYNWKLSEYIMERLNNIEKEKVIEFRYHGGYFIATYIKD